MNCLNEPNALQVVTGDVEGQLVRSVNKVGVAKSIVAHCWGTSIPLLRKTLPPITPPVHAFAAVPAE